MRRFVVAVVLPCVLVIAGCGDGEPDDDSAASPNQSPSESASVSESASPEKQAWQKRTKAGAKAFVRHYFAVADAAQASGETVELRHLEMKSCASCKGAREAIEKIHQRGGSIIGGKHSLTKLRTLSLVADKGKGWSAGVKGVLRTTAQEVVEAGDLSGEYDPGHLRLTMALVWDGKKWGVFEWDTNLGDSGSS